MTQPVTNSTPSTVFGTPPRPKSNIALISPSIQPSPTLPKPPHDYHDPSPLLKRVRQKDLKGLKNKEQHSLCVTDSAVKQGKALAQEDTAKKVSRYAKHLRLHPNTPPPPFEMEPGILVHVKENDHVEIQDRTRNKKRTYAVHRNGEGNKSIYPVGGDGIITTQKKTKAAPRDLLSIVAEYRADSTIKDDPKDFVKKRLESLLNSAS